MQNKAAVSASGIAKATGDTVQTRIDLRRRPRITESLIQGFLFLCGTISILTTIGIVYELSKESLNFLTRQLWEDTNKQLAVDAGAQETVLSVTKGGKALRPEQVLRVGDEAMRILSIDGETLTAERGLQGTQAVAHSAGNDLFLSSRVSLIEFFTKTKWTPQIGEFGIWPLVNATLMTSATAMVVALPLGLSVAVYLSEYASDRARKVLKPVLEVLAGIPTVVYGYFALTFMTPLLRSLFGVDTVEIYNTASAGIVIGILILPLVSSMSEDALSAVPHSLREAAYALGATKLETAVKVVLPAALSGITAAFIVAISRAIGETMIVAIAAGPVPPLRSIPSRPQRR
jgi:ABC-type phosphate transport system permease subunit